MATLYTFLNFVIAAVLAVVAFVAVFLQSRRSKRFLFTRYWLWVAGAAALFGLSWLIQSPEHAFLWVKLVSAGGFGLGVLAGGCAGLIARVVHGAV